MKTLMKFAGIAASLVLLSACTTTGPDIDASAGAGTDVASGPIGPVPGSQADLEESAGHRVFFAFNEYTLTPQAQGVLSRQAAWLQEYPETRVKLAGNADERGTREYNFALGARRAEAARAYLVSLGVDAARITTVSYGKERPLDPRSTEDAWSLNRNATTTISAAGA
ncbi:MAG: peptidoglycan-associated lipoprotein Pal [Alphaproteobacteria bacterium]|nr:peptidoglycan-associated lipoprotein Pal [Alphaproteobacteria bacterium]